MKGEFVKKKYLFFDVESIDKRHETICTFGYVLIDEQFNILEKEDILINPNIPKSSYDNFVVKSMLAYDIKQITSSPKFLAYADKILGLINNPDIDVIGFSIRNDLQYVLNELLRYGYSSINLGGYDVQLFHSRRNNIKNGISLENLLKDLYIENNELLIHNSRDDAEMTMLCVKKYCEELNCTIADFLKIYDIRVICKMSDIISRRVDKYVQTNLLDKYPRRKNTPIICISDSVKYSEKTMINLIEYILRKGFNYSTRVSECNYFVEGDGTGVKDKSCEYNISMYNKRINKITLKELETMLYNKSTCIQNRPRRIGVRGK